MTVKLYDLAKVTTATTGTGTITLGSAVSGFLSFAAAGVSNGETIRYGIRDGANSEVGYGVYTASGTTLTRNVTSSTNSNTAISLSGSAQVFICVSAFDVSSGPAFHAYGSSSTSVPINSWTKITLDAELYDTANCFNTSTSRFTPNVEGYYQFSFNAIVSAIIYTNWLPVLYKNGAEGLRGNQITGGVYGGGGNGMLYLNGSTDYVEFYLYQAYLNPATIGGGGSAAAAQTFLTGFLARRA
jgi:hypothetical protein